MIVAARLSRFRSFERLAGECGLSHIWSSEISRFGAILFAYVVFVCGDKGWFYLASDRILRRTRIGVGGA